MLEPSKKDLAKEKQSELDRLAKVNAECVAGYQVIRSYIYEKLEGAELEAMNKYIVNGYTKVYANLKTLIIDSLNEAKVKNVEVVEKLLNLNLRQPKLYKTLPNTPAFKYTNRVFTKKSVSLRSKKAANAITQIIANGRNNGLSLTDIQKKIDVVMGFRDLQGRITNKSKALIEAGKFTHRNGSIYETYRIARTEVARMNAIAKYEQFKDLNKDFNNCRLRLKAVIDGRERTQSRVMNGFVSNEKGEFVYPDGQYYKLGTAPAQWSINDRETSYFVFLNDNELKKQYNTQAEQRRTATAVYGKK